MKKNYRKYIIFTFLLIMLYCLFTPNVMAATDWSKICDQNDVKQAFKIAGYVVQLARWIVPLILIVLGMVDFGKAAISSDDKAISKATAALVRRFIAGVVVFFIPTIVLAILNVIDITNGIEEKSDTTFGQCTKCLFDPSDSCDVEES